MKCKDCKHWTERVRPTNIYVGWGDCSSPKLRQWNDDDAWDCATVDPGHDGEVCFGPLFGCIHFEPKP